MADIEVSLIPLTQEQKKTIDEAATSLHFLYKLTGREVFEEQAAVLVRITRDLNWQHRYRVPVPEVEAEA